MTTEDKLLVIVIVGLMAIWIIGFFVRLAHWRMERLAIQKEFEDILNAVDEQLVHDQALLKKYGSDEE